MEVRFWAATDTGRERGHNEDNYLVDRSLRLFVVCDGMGGHAAGEVASAAAIQTIRSVVEEGGSSIVDGSGLHRSPGDESAVLALLERAVQEASRRVWQMGQDDEARRGMGTTCSLIMFVGTRGFVAHVGDSRVYRMREGGVDQLTDDHSLRNHLIKKGKLEEDETLDRENAVTRAVGVADSIEVDTFAIDLQPGDRFVLCSDGLTEYLDQADMLLEIAADTDLEAATDACIDHANASGGKDNVTALLVEVDEGQGVWDARQSTPAGRALRVLPHFEQLTLEEFGVVADRVEVHDLDPGTLLVEADDSPEGLMLVIDGRVELSRDGDVLDIVRGGDFFGERALLGAAQGGLAAEVAEPSTIAVLSRSGFESILAESEQLAAKISWNFLIRLMGKLRHLDEVEFRNPQLASLAQSAPSDEGLEDTDDFSQEEKVSAASARENLEPSERSSKTSRATGTGEPESSAVDPAGETTEIAEEELSNEIEQARQSTERQPEEDEPSPVSDAVGPPDWDPTDDALGAADDSSDASSSAEIDGAAGETGPRDRDSEADTLVPGVTDEDSDPHEVEESTASGAKILSRETSANDEEDETSGAGGGDDDPETDADADPRETVQLEDFDSESIDRD